MKTSRRGKKILVICLCLFGAVLFGITVLPEVSSALTLPTLETDIQQSLGSLVTKLQQQQLQITLPTISNLPPTPAPLPLPTSTPIPTPIPIPVPAPSPLPISSTTAPKPIICLACGDFSSSSVPGPTSTPATNIVSVLMAAFDKNFNLADVITAAQKAGYKAEKVDYSFFSVVIVRNPSTNKVIMEFNSAED